MDQKRFGPVDPDLIQKLGHAFFSPNLKGVPEMVVAEADVLRDFPQSGDGSEMIADELFRFQNMRLRDVPFFRWRI